MTNPNLVHVISANDLVVRYRHPDVDDRAAQRVAYTPALSEYEVNGYPAFKLQTREVGLAVLNAVMQTEHVAGRGGNAYAGIDGANLLYQGRLFGNFDREAKEDQLRKSFYATRQEYWERLVADANNQNNPFFYAVGRQREIPAIISFDASKITASGIGEASLSERPDVSVTETVWFPQEPHTTESAVAAVYYLQPDFMYPPIIGDK